MVRIATKQVDYAIHFAQEFNCPVALVGWTREDLLMIRAHIMRHLEWTHATHGLYYNDDHIELLTYSPHRPAISLLTFQRLLKFRLRNGSRSIETSDDFIWHNVRENRPIWCGGVPHVPVFLIERTNGRIPLAARRIVQEIDSIPPSTDMCQDCDVRVKCALKLGPQRPMAFQRIDVLREPSLFSLWRPKIAFHLRPCLWTAKL